jgi:hypothetical protein
MVMEGVYIFLIVFGTICAMYAFFEPVVKCYYKCFPYKREQIIEV